jgi:3-oxoacyl-[acyl-carrier protein] reductase
MMTSVFSGKVAIVTGSCRGIGRAIAEELAARGAIVTLNYPFQDDVGEAQEAVAAIEQGGGRAIAVEADLSRMADIGKLFDASARAFGPPDFVISNVGGIVRSCRIEDFDEALFDQVMTLNAKSAFFVLQRAAREVRTGGRIVAISSSTTSMPYPGTAGYAGGKAALELFCAVLAREIGSRQITVNSVSPGLTTTEGMRSAPPPDDRVEQVKAATPLGRLGEAKDIAASVILLLSEDAHWITGQSIKAGGGFH